MAGMESDGRRGVAAKAEVRALAEGAEECSGDRVCGVGGKIYNISPKI